MAFHGMMYFSMHFGNIKITFVSIRMKMERKKKETLTYLNCINFCVVSLMAFSVIMNRPLISFYSPRANTNRYKHNFLKRQYFCHVSFLRDIQDSHLRATRHSQVSHPSSSKLHKDIPRRFSSSFQLFLANLSHEAKTGKSENVCR